MVNIKILSDDNFRNFLKKEILFSYERNINVTYSIIINEIEINIYHIDKNNIKVNMSYKKLYEFIKQYNIIIRKNKILNLIDNSI
jgi:hypothetical protein